MEQTERNIVQCCLYNVDIAIKSLIAPAGKNVSVPLEPVPSGNGSTPVHHGDLTRLKMCIWEMEHF